MAMIFDQAVERGPGIAYRIDVFTQSHEFDHEAVEVARSHAAIGVEQGAVVGVAFVPHGRLVKKALDTLVVPDLIDDFFFIWTHGYCLVLPIINRVGMITRSLK